MKFNLDKNYLKICKYVVLTAVLIYISIELINMVPMLWFHINNLVSSILSMLYPFILGLIIAYLMYGPTTTIECFLLSRKHIRIKNRMICRSIGIAVSYLVVFGIIIGIFVGIYFMVGGQLSKNTTFSKIIESVSTYLNNNSLSTDSVKNVISKWDIPFTDLLSEQVDKVASTLESFLGAFVGSLANSLVSVGSNIASFLIALILSIYVLASHEYFKSIWKRTFFFVFRNSNLGKSIRRCLGIINFTFSKYIRGQLIEAFIVGVFSTIALMIVGIDYAIIIGIIAGITNLIPYVGPLIGTILAVLMALFSGNIWQAVGALIAMQIVQQIDGNILAPKIVGDIVGLHPALIIIAILVGGSTYGLLGMLIAVPIAASIKTLLSDWYSSHYEEAFNNSSISKDIDPATYIKKEYKPRRRKCNPMTEDELKKENKM